MKKRREKVKQKSPVVQQVKQNISASTMNISGEQQISDISYQGILHQVLVGIMRLMLESSTAKTLHSLDETQSFIQTQAEAYIEEELSRKLNNDPDEGFPHKMLSSYCRVSSSLLNELELSLLKHPEREKIHELNSSNNALRMETIRVQEKCNEELARKDQEIESLKSEKNILQLKNNSLLCALEMLERELRKTKMGLNDAQQSNVALTMQYVDYKAEVTQCADNIVNSVKSRVGFLPRRIQNNICRIKSSKIRAKHPTNESNPNLAHTSADESRQSQRIIDVRESNSFG